MKILFIDSIRFSVLLLLFLILVNCAVNESDKNKKSYPVKWHTGFTMPTLLAVSDISLKSVNDFPKLINAPWYADMVVKNKKGKEVTLSSCADYFDKHGASARTVSDNEMNAYLEFKVMCEATQLLINAFSSKESFVPSIILDEETPRVWPKQIALIISEKEASRAYNNSDLRSWHDVTPITKIDKSSTTQSIYFHDSGYQEVELLAHGDFNRDGVEDVIVVVHDYVDGGSYFNMRLFVLSVNAEGGWELVKEV